jgi:hypothetical protein
MVDKARACQQKHAHNHTHNGCTLQQLHAPPHGMQRHAKPHTHTLVHIVTLSLPLFLFLSQAHVQLQEKQHQTRQCTHSHATHTMSVPTGVHWGWHAAQMWLGPSLEDALPKVAAGIGEIGCCEPHAASSQKTKESLLAHGARTYLC